MKNLNMFKIFKGWIQRYLSDEEAVVLLLLLICGFAVVITMGGMLTPVFASMLLAYLLQGVVGWMERRAAMPHLLAVTTVFLLFVTLLLFFVFMLIPLLWDQITNFVNELPRMVIHGEELLRELPRTYPGFISEDQIEALIQRSTAQAGKFGQWALSSSLASLPGIVGLLIYLVLVPILIFFFLKDRQEITAWFTARLPRERRLLKQVAEEMNQQISNYIRGKAVEIAVVAAVSWIAFFYLGLNYAVLLSLAVGISVVIPYIGAAVVTIPIALVGLFQWGWGNEFFLLMIVYGIIQALDGNVLVPLLFSEAVNLHPVAIIVAVLVFGGFWGFWGVFFAIPLATLLKAVLNAWPKTEIEGEPG